MNLLLSNPQYIAAVAFCMLIITVIGVYLIEKSDARVAKGEQK